ncbi:MAG: hypothetical protein Q9167_005426 [Letrouitia subvulpina]
MVPPPSPSSLAFQRAHVHEDRRGGIVAVNVVTIIIAYTAVSLRWISRRLAGTKFGADDGWICVALVSITGYVAGLSTMVHYGIGRHTILVVNPKTLVIVSLNPPPLCCLIWKFIAAVQSTTVTAMCYNTSNLSVKISILFLYRRIFPTRWLKFTLLALGLFALAQWISFNLVVILQCVPISSQWLPGISARCVKFSMATLISGVINVVTDILILASPMHTVWRLKASKARKRLITVTFLLGGITTANASTTRSKSYGHLPGDQSSIRLKPIGRTWSSHVAPSRSDEDEALYPRFGGSVHVEGGIKSPQSTRGNDITVTRQFTTTTSAKD